MVVNFLVKFWNGLQWRNRKNNYNILWTWRISNFSKKLDRFFWSNNIWSKNILESIRWQQNLVKNWNSKIRIFVQKSNFFFKNRNFFQKSKFVSKIEFCFKKKGQKTKFCSKVEILVKNQNFGRKTNFGQKSKLCSNIKFL